MPIARPVSIALVSLFIAQLNATAPGKQAPIQTRACFLLFEVGVGQVRRRPAAACQTRITPASTFKVPHALAALDAGVISGPDEQLPFVDDGREYFESSRRPHTLATAIRHSVLWYFQRIAERLGPDREAAYLRKFGFGNMDSTSGLTSFWIGGSLQISPEEQQAFWLKLYRNELPASARAVEQVKAMLVQPAGVVVNAAGEQPFARPWRANTTVSAKTGSATDRSGQAARWLVGYVKQGNRSFVFVSCVIGPPDLGSNAAIELAARSLREEGVI
jgi:beta-lactamase class D